MANDRVPFFVNTLKSHPVFPQMVKEMTERDLGILAVFIENSISNQEFCANCEGWSLFDEDQAIVFCIRTAVEMISYGIIREVDSLPDNLRMIWVEDNYYDKFEVISKLFTQAVTERMSAMKHFQKHLLP